MRSKALIGTVLLVAVFQLQGCTRHPTVSSSYPIILGTWGTPTDLNRVITFTANERYFVLENDGGLRFEGAWKLDKDKLTVTTTGEEGEQGERTMSIVRIGKKASRRWESVLLARSGADPPHRKVPPAVREGQEIARRRAAGRI